MIRNRMSSAILAICCTFAAIPSMGTAQTGCATNADAVEGEVLIITPSGQYCTASDEERAELDQAVAESYAALALEKEAYDRAVAKHKQALAAQEAAQDAAARAAAQAARAAEVAMKAAEHARQAAGSPPPGAAGIHTDAQQKSEAARANAECMGQPGFTAAQCKGRAVAMQQQAARK